MYAREGQDLTLAAAGDAIISRRISACDDERLRTLVQPIQEADASLVNLEVLLHDFEGYPAAISPGTYMQAPPWAADELSWAGFNLFAAATNHAGDYSHGGMEATIRELEARDLAYAGLGHTLAEARAPTYLDTAGGRVAMISACSSVTPGTEAGEQSANLQGRPGISPLHLDVTYTVPDDVCDQLAEISEKIGLEAVKRRREELGIRVQMADAGSDFTLMNVGEHTEDIEFERGDEFGIRLDADDGDRAAILERIRGADRQADWVIASLHTHQGGNGFRNDQSVPPFLESFARECIDAGADAVVGHGPHMLRGIEIYDGAPVFYSLGNFIFQNQTHTRLPPEMYERYDVPTDAPPADLFDARYFDADGAAKGLLGQDACWQSVLPVCEFEDGSLDHVDIYPVDLGSDTQRPQRGRPLLVDGPRAVEILEEIADLSAPYGTEISIDGDRGSIRP